MNKKEVKNLKKLSSSLKKNFETAKNAADSARLKALTEILKQPDV